jgi:hypothetical protein
LLEAKNCILVILEPIMTKRYKRKGQYESALLELVLSVLSKAGSKVGMQWIKGKMASLILRRTDNNPASPLSDEDRRLLPWVARVES